MSRKLSCVLVCLLVSWSLAACSDDAKTGPSSSNNSLSDATSQDATSQDGSTADAGGDVGDSGDGGAERCTDNDACRGGPHQAGICDTGSNTCSYTCEEGFGDCDGDVSNGCEVDLTQSVDHCGACANACAPEQLHLAPICAESSCDVDPDGCAPGFVDFDERGDNGCECEITDADDTPGDGDTNCDGFDGIVDGDGANVVFVSSDAGSDDDDGLSADTAKATIGAGLEAAASGGRDYVLVSGGEYVEAVELRSGISIYGGYDADDGWTRNTTDQTTTIRAPAPTDDVDAVKSVAADGVSDPTVLDHLTIEGADLSAADSGAASYALWARDSDGLVVQDSFIDAGAGANGGDGEDGDNGEDTDCTPLEGGSPGDADASQSACAAASDSSAAAGDKGQIPTAGGGEGGAGGTYSCKEQKSACSPDVVNGQDGQPGDDGAGGDDGMFSADVQGAIEAGMWSPPTADPTTDGAKGSGGGGGGAGANCECQQGFCGGLFGINRMDTGGDGAKGGKGGCPGTAGTNGEPGGASFGIFAVRSDLSLRDCRIDVGSGGNGGAGGKGSRGASGDPENTDVGPHETYGGIGGSGGRGGLGGDGGDGAGGCGGSAIGLVLSESTVDQSTLNIDKVNGMAGAPGVGGDHPGDPDSAADGCAGAVEKVRDFSADATP